MLAACGGPQTGPAGAAPSAEVECPAPIGTIPRESCTDIADDFGALSVSGALKLAGSSKGAEQRIEAIRAAGDLATALKDQRVALCERYNACKLPPAEHAAEDQRLAGMMKKLIEAWDARKFSKPEEVQQFRAQVAALQAQLDGTTVSAGEAPAGTDASAGAGAVTGAGPTKVEIAASDLARVEGAGLAFSAGADGVTVASKGDGSRDVLRSKADKLKLEGGSRYLVKVTGSYTPAGPAPLIAGGDELNVRFKYRTTQAGDLYIALRSLEDPDAVDSTVLFKVGAGATGTQQATLTASPGASGFYVAIGARSAGPLDLDDVEVARGGSTIATARAEVPSEAQVKTSCKPSAAKPLAGKGAFHCEATGPDDRLTIGMPPSHLYLAIRGPSGERAILRTLSLAGGRSLDAALTEDADLVIGLVGPGSTTIRGVEVQKLSK
jgi:hypothetical protein